MLWFSSFSRSSFTGRIDRETAAKAVWVFGGAGASILFATCPPLTGVLAVSNIPLYGYVYTKLKMITPYNTEIGGIVGAIPPLIGWSAACGSLGLGAAGLAALLYVWQIPHFHCLSVKYREDYTKGGYKMLIVVNPEKIPTLVTLYTAALLPLGFIFPLAEVTNWTFPLVAAIPSAWFLSSVVQFARHFRKDPHGVSAVGTRKAMKAFMGSVYFLMIYFLLLVLFRLDVDERCVELIGGENALEKYQKTFGVTSTKHNR